ncbi:hypothetical protein A2982_03015 [candidate division WWE3 bacterium RIFCSPLOWO2_01_FULL_39_13]|uniref:FAD-binding FR-type domain-containing protein n=1 Tax=candidate division WWE3 bacterium RIFCSPLOWO2_01_FULL_39_13 TaxID=1802624 RepID=A0A1F4V1V0_UNCKA|nr:MAG: hypothetical protein A2982_03015 [candidate division WWE3 bacterium RIFCSPLOWO2_01_FULL_39_13]
MIKAIDYFLNRITMYRLVLYILVALILTGMLAGIFGYIPYSAVSIGISVILVVGICCVSNRLFSAFYNAPVNVESVYITALILVLILHPVQNTSDIKLLVWASILSMASKYIFAVNRKHIFNPAAIAVVLTSIGFGGSGSWWVGYTVMTPVVIIGSLLIIRKIKREDLFFAFVLTAVVVGSLMTINRGGNILTFFNHLLFRSSLFFFAGIMLTEPLTTPPSAKHRIIYGIITGVLFLPQIHIKGFYTTPELALVLGNIYSYLVSPKEKLWLALKEKVMSSRTVVDFVFHPVSKFSYLPGQYMEWTLAHDHPDTRGNRRYFTLASSPTEDNIKLGVKFYEKSSSFKKSLFGLEANSHIIASQLAGNFTLPNDPSKKLAFIAGGIGVTPFRSMIKYLIDKNEARSIILLYFNKTEDEIVYKDVFEHAKELFDIRTVYVLSDLSSISDRWKGRKGIVTDEMIRKEVPDYKERLFYISGSHVMVSSCGQILKSMGLKNSQIKRDYFPGLT